MKLFSFSRRTQSTDKPSPAKVEQLENRLMMYAALSPEPSVQGTDQPTRFYSGDFNNDGRQDVLTRNYNTGDVRIFINAGYDSGTNAFTFNTPVTPKNSTDTNWWIVGTGDFNNDGHTDILWRNYSTGTNSVWFLNGTTFVSSARLSIDTTPTQWAVQGTGDFNHDSKPDILWRNYSTGANTVWFMNGTVRTNSVTVGNNVTDLNWQMLGSGDFNNDGNPDILWRNYATGANTVWHMNGTTRIDAIRLTPGTTADPQWEMSGIGDFDGNGTTDILWRNYTSGNDSAWLMNGSVRTIAGQILPFQDF